MVTGGTWKTTKDVWQEPSGLHLRVNRSIHTWPYQKIVLCNQKIVCVYVQDRNNQPILIAPRLVEHLKMRCTPSKEPQLLVSICGEPSDRVDRLQTSFHLKVSSKRKEAPGNPITDRADHWKPSTRKPILRIYAKKEGKQKPFLVVSKSPLAMSSVEGNNSTKG